MKSESELRRGLLELDDVLEVPTRRIALIGSHLRFSAAVTDPEALDVEAMKVVHPGLG
jgi:hypothetical protein